MNRQPFMARMLILAISMAVLGACTNVSALGSAAGFGSLAGVAQPQAAGGLQDGQAQAATPGAQGRRGQGGAGQPGAGQQGAPQGGGQGGRGSFGQQGGAQGGRGQGGFGGARGNTRAVPVEVAKAATGVISQTFSYAGTLQSHDSVKITPMVSGRIDSVNIGVGDAVKAGDVIAQIEKTIFEAQVAQAQAGYDAAQQKLVRAQIGSRPEEIAAAQAAVRAAQVALNAQTTPTNDQRTVAAANMEKAAAALQQAQADYDKVAGRPDVATTQQALNLQQATISYQSAMAAYNLTVTPTDGQLAPLQNALAQAQLKLVQTKQPYLASDMAQFQAAVDQAKAQLAMAKTQLDNTTIRAPFDGVVAEVYISKGTLVGPAAPVVLFVSGTNTVSMDVEESHIAQVKNGEDATLRVSAYPDRVFAGKVTSVAPVADSKTHSFSVVVTPTDDGKLLRPGMYADVSILANLKPNALLVPSAAIVQTPQNQTIVYVVKSDNTVEARPVTVGLADPAQVEILSGLQAGETVVTAGQSTLVNGANVTMVQGG